MSGDLNPETGKHDFSHRSWAKKFQVSLQGLGQGIRGRGDQRGLNSFAVHLPAALVVIAAGWALSVGWQSMALLALSIGMVMVAELFNTALESLSQAVVEGPNPHVKTALDVSSGAVLLATLIAITVGILVFGPKLVLLLAF